MATATKNLSPRALPAELVEALQRLTASSLQRDSPEMNPSGAVHAMNLPESDRLLLTLAHSLWRGVGPTVRIEQLWGIDADTGARILACLAEAMDPSSDGRELLAQATMHLDNSTVVD